MPYRYYAIVPDNTGRKVVLLQSPDGWTLPYLELDNWVIWQKVDHVAHQIKAQLGVDVTALRCLRIIQDLVLGTDSPIFVMEKHDPGWSPSTNGRWATQADLKEIDLAVEAHAPVISDWLQSNLDTRPHPLTPDWYLPGWFQSATEWTTEQCSGLGIELIAPVEQFHKSQRSSVLRARTSRSFVYMKAVPEMFEHELPLTQALSEQFPQLLPEVLAMDAQRSWLLMDDCGDDDLGSYEDLAVWQAVLESYSRVQVDLTNQTNRLFTLGCPDWGLEHLADSIDGLLTDTSAMLPDTPWGLTTAEIDNLQNRASEFKDACGGLLDYSVPHTLEHGDFGYWQVIVSGDRYRFIDWSDSSVSHPFFSMWFLIEELRYGAPKLVASSEKLRDAYLKAWTDFEPMERLVEAFELARPLASLHQASKYRQTIIPQVDAKWEWEKMVPYFLKRLV